MLYKGLVNFSTFALTSVHVAYYVFDEMIYINKFVVYELINMEFSI